jgi:hypothetical protein
MRWKNARRIYEQTFPEIDPCYYDESSYRHDGPPTDVQLDERVPFSLMRMYRKWASLVVSKDVHPRDLDQALRFVSEFMYGVTEYGLRSIQKCHWDMEFPNTLSADLVVRLPEDPSASDQVLDEIRERVQVLLDAGVDFKTIESFVQNIPVSEVHD